MSLASTLVRFSLLLLLATGTLGCFRLGYLAQAALGQDDIAYRMRPIHEVLADSSVPERTRKMLAVVERAKKFGQDHGLNPTSSYEAYADLKRSAVVWVVSACQPLRFEVQTWTFPIVGSVPYLGWFERRDAERHAARLRRAGLDVNVRPARAYSTLGWFDDPVLSTMIRGGKEALADLVDVVLHESVHSTLYIGSQSRFNESLASFVARELTRDFLRSQIGLKVAAAYLQDQADVDRRRARMHEIYKQLDQLYRSSQSDAAKRKKKAQWLAALRAELGFQREINNATLAQSRTYHAGAVPFARLLARCGNIKTMMAALKRVGPDSFGSPQQLDLDPVLARVCRSR
ncbi:MAG: aminopeptidase [Polyangiaceae bacterium]